MVVFWMSFLGHFAVLRIEAQVLTKNLPPTNTYRPARARRLPVEYVALHILHMTPTSTDNFEHVLQVVDIITV